MIQNNKNILNLLSLWLIFMFFLVASIIVVGGLTRLTDSGLSITKWELFTGVFPPFNQEQWLNYFALYKEIPEFKLQNYNMSLEEFKIIFWWEWGHRLLGRFIGLFFLVPLIFFIFKLGLKRTTQFITIFLLICLQGFIGWFMVESGLVNEIDVSHFRLSMHLTTAFIILSLILWQILKIKINFINKEEIKFKLPLIFLFLVFLQISVGAFVSGMDAGKIYNSWPLMGENYFPNDSNFNELFMLSALSEPSLVQFIHRNLAYLILIVYFIILYFITSRKLEKFYNIIKFLGIVLLLQIFLGILTIISGAQIIVASMHQISSILLISFSIYLFFLNTKKN
tara:strand:- start:3871 stop:4887 length:1017 start_codon:yes stop_codon:yes gene_type:complete